MELHGSTGTQVLSRMNGAWTEQFLHFRSASLWWCSVWSMCCVGFEHNCSFPRRSSPLFKLFKWFGFAGSRRIVLSFWNEHTPHTFYLKVVSAIKSKHVTVEEFFFVFFFLLASGLMRGQWKLQAIYSSWNIKLLWNRPAPPEPQKKKKCSNQSEDRSGCCRLRYLAEILTLEKCAKHRTA